MTSCRRSSKSSKRFHGLSFSSAMSVHSHLLLILSSTSPSFWPLPFGTGPVPRPSSGHTGRVIGSTVYLGLDAVRFSHSGSDGYERATRAQAMSRGRRVCVPLVVKPYLTTREGHPAWAGRLSPEKRRARKVRQTVERGAYLCRGGCALLRFPKLVEAAAIANISVPEKWKKYELEFREGAARIVQDTGQPIAAVARHLGGGGTW